MLFISQSESHTHKQPPASILQITILYFNFHIWYATYNTIQLYYDHKITIYACFSKMKTKPLSARSFAQNIYCYTVLLHLVSSSTKTGQRCPHSHPQQRLCLASTTAHTDMSTGDTSNRICLSSSCHIVTTLKNILLLERTCETWTKSWKRLFLGSLMLHCLENKQSSCSDDGNVTNSRLNFEKGNSFTMNLHEVWSRLYWKKLSAAYQDQDKPTRLLYIIIYQTLITWTSLHK